LAYAPTRLTDAALQERLGAAFDPEHKIDRAVASLLTLPGARVIAVDSAGSERARRLEQAGAVVSTVQTVGRARLAAGSADAVIGFWNILAGSAAHRAAELRSVERLLAPGGMVIAVHDYGRDDASLLLADEAHRRELVQWSHRNGPFLGQGFKVHVLHCWWQFPSVEEAGKVLAAGFGPEGETFAATLRRPRVSHKVAVYHRTFPAP
jgi:hypothetical protein